MATLAVPGREESVRAAGVRHEVWLVHPDEECGALSRIHSPCGGGGGAAGCYASGMRGKSGHEGAARPAAMGVGLLSQPGAPNHESAVNSEAAASECACLSRAAGCSVLARYLIVFDMTTSTPSMEKVEAKREEGGEVTVSLMTQAEFSDKMETYQAFVQAKAAELTRLIETLKIVRDTKEPLAQVKNCLQEEINSCNTTINAVSEEATHLKQKLRYHSVRQIHDNIERLEYQLRNNNFKPREEQKILDEISMLQRSIRTLREYEAKQAENKKFRAERTRLIEERNDNYSKVRALYAKDDEIKKEIAALRGDISANRKSIDQLRQLRPKLEQEWVAEQQKLQAARNRRHEEKKRVRQEQIRERQEERRKLWEEYEASQEPYEEEKTLCRLLIGYLQSSGNGSTPTPTTPASTCSRRSSCSTPSLTPASTPTLPASPFPSFNYTEATSSPSKCKDMVPPESSGAYYCKPKEDNAFLTLSKRGKAKARREQRLAHRTKELPHTPDVLLKFSKLSITPPRNTDQVPAAILSLQDQLQRFHSLALSKSGKTQADGCLDGTNKTKDTGKYSRPNSLPVASCSQPTSAAITAATEQDSTTEGKENGILSPMTPSSSATHVHSVNTPITIPEINVVAPCASWAGSVISNHVSTDSLKEGRIISPSKTEPVYNGISPAINGMRPDASVPDLQMCSDILSAGNSESYFSGPMSYTCNVIEEKSVKEPNNNGSFSYAAVAAKVKPLDF
ncbi:hypothetical protein GWK47_047355 [Chionoecetes opilio]|uniref:Uncharacterized protein n=1 Tax=Chionoecetes opilio TaxID=41210 RepID=A0A8J4YC27_CHIOP|nr:hypothetical protein GWK47_047355 [Chionoecetes opilio]